MHYLVTKTIIVLSSSMYEYFKIFFSDNFLNVTLNVSFLIEKVINNFIKNKATPKCEWKSYE
jgi:hypothetical protein